MRLDGALTDGHLRFDFSHFQRVTVPELVEVENRVNQLIRENAQLEEHRRISMKQAEEMGAMMLFGEKYGDTVRAIKFGDSVELCGGTHVPATGNIGIFKIVHESAVAAGIRRIEAITAEKANTYMNEQLGVLDEVKTILKNPNNPVAGIKALQDEHSRMKKEIDQLRKEKAKQVKTDLVNGIEDVNGLRLLARKVDLDTASIKDLAFELKTAHENLMLVLANSDGPKATISVALSDNLVNERQLHAGKMVKELAALIKGGGGGQPFFATAGGKNPEGIDAALAKAKELASNA